MSELRHELDVDTAVEQTGEGSFRATVTDRWNTFAGPNGGYILAICARAMLEDVPFPHPLAVSGHFLRPPTPGPAEVRTHVVRTGRRHAVAEASLFQSGKEAVRVVSTFTDLESAGGRTLLLASPPKLPPPETMGDPLDDVAPAVPVPSLGKRLAFRAPHPPGWLTGSPSGDPTFEGWVRFQDARQPDPLALTFLVDSFAPAVLEVGEFVSSTIELTVYVRGIPRTPWLAARQWTRYLTSGYHEEEVELWDANGTLVAQARQLALLG